MSLKLTPAPNVPDNTLRRFLRLARAALVELDKRTTEASSQGPVFTQTRSDSGGSGSGDGSTLSDFPAEPLGPTAEPGLQEEASRYDHIHPFPSAAEVGADPAGTAAAAVAAHEADPDAHPQYSQLGSAPAAVALSGHRAVYKAAGALNYASSDDVVTADAVIGITTMAAAQGSTETYRKFGEMSETSWAWTPNEPIYLGVNGVLTQTPPSTGAQIDLGYAIDATSMMVRIEPALFIDPGVAL